MAKILICDDSDFMRKTIREILEKDEHEIVGEAKNGEEAVEKFTLFKPDLVTMDILMRPDGIGAIRKIKDMEHIAKIIVVSILEGNQAEVVEGIRLGADSYVGKPIKREILMSEVKRVLGQTKD